MAMSGAQRLNSVMVRIRTRPSRDTWATPCGLVSSQGCRPETGQVVGGRSVNGLHEGDALLLRPPQSHLDWCYRFGYTHDYQSMPMRKPEKQFGGSWTEVKLDRLRRYLALIRQSCPTPRTTRLGMSMASQAAATG